MRSNTESSGCRKDEIQRAYQNQCVIPKANKYEFPPLKRKLHECLLLVYLLDCDPRTRKSRFPCAFIRAEKSVLMSQGCLNIFSKSASPLFLLFQYISVNLLSTFSSFVTSFLLTDDNQIFYQN